MYGWIVLSGLVESSSCDMKHWVGARSRGLGWILILKGLWKSYCPYQVCLHLLKVTKKSQTGSQIDFSKAISGGGVLDLGGLSLKSTLRTSLVVRWLRLHASNAGGMGQFLVRELRSHMQPKKKKKDFWVPFLNPAVTIIVQKHLLATHSLADTVIFYKGFAFISCVYGNCWTETITRPSAWLPISFKQIHFNSPS